jgi:cytochrome c oxidase subunit II
LTTIARERLTNHGMRIAVIWLVLTAIVVPLVVLVLGPQIPPGDMSAEAGAQHDANVLMTALTAPIVLIVLVVGIYSFINFRASGEAIVDGPPIKGGAGTQLLWIVVTSAIVLTLAVWGSYTLIVSSHGSGGGQGPNPIAKPKDWQRALPVQVIGQQWEWTFRYPTYEVNGKALETRDLAIPDHTLVAFHVTSLDVTHSFWAYELGVKADAVSGVDNIAYVNARRTGFFHIRCAELCGLWHGHMSKLGRVLTFPAFQAWIKAAEKRNAPIMTCKGCSAPLPPYNPWYYPAPNGGSLKRAG